MLQRFQRLIALMTVFVLAVPASTFAENRSRARTDLEKLAADLEARLGRGSVVIEGADAPVAASTATPYRSILDAMNRERAARGLVPLRLNDALNRAAANRIDDMLAKHYFAHVSPDGVQPFVWATRQGYRYRLIGENLALGYRGTAVVDGWMHSPGHRENILERSFDEVGIAVADTSPRKGYRAPLVVALYGTR